MKAYVYTNLKDPDPITYNTIENIIDPDVGWQIVYHTHDGSANNHTSYTVNFPVEINCVRSMIVLECDILVVGGGGGGGSDIGGGGGGGAVWIVRGAIIPPDNYSILLGKGGSAGTSLNGGNGVYSFAFGINARGGGGGSKDYDGTAVDGSSGGSGGGAGAYQIYNKAGGTSTIVIGFT